MPKLVSGFTLIELLMVIAIIGILSSVVLASLGTARTRSKDAAIQADMHSLLTQAEIYNNTNGSYGSAVSVTVGVCPTSGTSMFAADAAVQNQIQHINSLSPTTATCYSNGSSRYFVQASLATSGYVCVDWTGRQATSSSPVTTGDTQCP